MEHELDLDDNLDDNYVGRRLRELRTYAGLSLEVTAGLAGMSTSYLSRLETGHRPVPNRQVEESLAYALKVAPTEFTRRPAGTPTDDPLTRRAHAALPAIEDVLDICELGEDPGEPAPEWGQLTEDLRKLASLAQDANYAEQGELVPRLLRELHATYLVRPDLREPVLLGMIRAYASAMWITKRIGSRGLSLVAAKAAQERADELGAPAWRGYTTWLRGDATGALSRPQQYARSVRMADELTPHLNDPDVVQAYGMLHLSAALAKSVQSDRDAANTHLDEAARIASRMDDEVGQFGWLWFGRPNVGIWRATIDLEFGDGAKVAENARNVHVAAIPSRSRQAEYYCELGRALLIEPKKRDAGLRLLLQAEELAPQRVRTDTYVREAVADRLREVRRSAGGPELRGFAWRLGIAPSVPRSGDV